MRHWQNNKYKIKLSSKSPFRYFCKLLKYKWSKRNKYSQTAEINLCNICIKSDRNYSYIIFALNFGWLQHCFCINHGWLVGIGVEKPISTKYWSGRNLFGLTDHFSTLKFIKNTYGKIGLFKTIFLFWYKLSMT